MTAKNPGLNTSLSAVRGGCQTQIANTDHEEKEAFEAAKELGLIPAWFKHSSTLI